ncbi:MAG: dTDP-4-dehydrorhamnose reductase family protein [Xanthobacteraceae bacterium]
MSASTRQRLRVLVLGGTGMLGHKLVHRLAARGFWVAATIRSSSTPDTPAARAALGGAAQILTAIDVLQDEMLARSIDLAEPDVVVNAVGVIKQLHAAPIPSITTNSLLPHRVAALCGARGARLIHLSTDCVFSGRKGPYAEDSPTDAEDLYGRSKLLGEAGGKGCLTIRSSIVGRELRGRSSLIEWFLSQRGGRVTGYAGALYTGLTTSVMADLIGDLAIDHPDLDGIWHVASEVISKYELLMLVNRQFGLGIDLTRDDSFVVDRRLDGGRFRTRTGFSAPSWDAMIAEMRSDPTPYDA